MSCLGVLFAVDEDVINRINGLEMSKRPQYISNELEDIYFDDYPERTAELDKAWDAMHRTLTDGSLCFDCSNYPNGNLILGGEILYYDGEEYDDYIITAKSPDMVKELAGNLEKIKKANFKKAYFDIDKTYQDELDKEDFEYTWEYFEEVIPFIRNAAAKNLWVLFTVDQ